MNLNEISVLVIVNRGKCLSS